MYFCHLLHHSTPSERNCRKPIVMLLAELVIQRRARDQDEKNHVMSIYCTTVVVIFKTHSTLAHILS